MRARIEPQNNGGEDGRAFATTYSFKILRQHDIAVVAVHVDIEQSSFIARYCERARAGGNESAHRGYPNDSFGWRNRRTGQPHPC